MDREKIIAAFNQFCPGQTGGYIEAMAKLDGEKNEVLLALQGKPNKIGKQDLLINSETKLAIYPKDWIKRINKIIKKAGELIGITISDEDHVTTGVFNAFESYYSFAKTVPKVVHAGVIN